MLATCRHPAYSWPSVLAAKHTCTNPQAITVNHSCLHVPPTRHSLTLPVYVCFCCCQCRREAEETARALARTEGLLLGVSAGGAVSAALRLAATVSNAVIVVLACDRADRYLCTGVYSAAAAAADPAPCPVSEIASAVARFAAYPSPHYIWFADAAAGSVGQQAADELQAQAQQKVDAQQGTMLVVRGHLDVADAAVQRLVQHPVGAGDADDAPVLVQWHAGDRRKVAAQRADASSGADAAAHASVLVSGSMLSKGMEMVL